MGNGELILIGSDTDRNVYSISLSNNDKFDNCKVISTFPENINPFVSVRCNYINDKNEKCVLFCTSSSSNTYASYLNSNYFMLSYNCDTNQWTNITKLFNLDNTVGLKIIITEKLRK